MIRRYSVFALMASVGLLIQVGAAAPAAAVQPVAALTESALAVVVAPTGGPTFNLQAPFELTVPGCLGGTANFTLTPQSSSVLTFNGVRDDGTGSYTVSFVETIPSQGHTRVHVEFNGCSSPAGPMDFDIESTPAPTS